MDFAQVRQKYPQYNDIPDGELAQRLHQKFYADLPFEEFAQKVGFNAAPPAPEGFFASIPGKVAEFMQPVKARAAAATPPPKNMGERAIKYAVETSLNIPESAAGVAAAIPQQIVGVGKKMAKQGLANFNPALALGEQAVEMGKGIAEYAGKAILSPKQTFHDDPVGMALLAKGGVKAAKAAPSKLIPESLPNKLYGSAVKFSTTLTPAERLSQTRAGIKEGIYPTSSGASKLRGKIDSINQQISAVISEAAKTGDHVKVESVIERLQPLRKLGDNVMGEGGQKIIQAIDNAEASLRTHKNAVLMGDELVVPAEVAQQMKQATYRTLKDAYGELSSPLKEAAKQLARGMKEELATMYPDLAKLNAKDSVLIDLYDSIERAANRVGNRDVIGIGIPLKTATGAAVDMTTGGTLGKVAGGLASILDIPRVKTGLAIALDRARNIGRKPPTPSAPPLLPRKAPQGRAGRVRGEDFTVEKIGPDVSKMTLDEFINSKLDMSPDVDTFTRRKIVSDATKDYADLKGQGPATAAPLRGAAPTAPPLLPKKRKQP